MDPGRFRFFRLSLMRTGPFFSIPGILKKSSIKENIIIGLFPKFSAISGKKDGIKYDKSV